MKQPLFQHFDPSEWPMVEQILDWQTQVGERYQRILTPFLNPRERYLVANVIGQSDTMTIAGDGGFQSAENQRLLLYPYYEEVSREDFGLQLFEIAYPKKFGALTHGQIMGTILGAGIQRNRLGDIVQREDEAGNVDWQVVVDREFAAMLAQNVTRIGKTSVKLVPLPLEDAYPAEADWKTQESSVSSFRLDTLLAEGFHLSRTKVKAFIEAGAVKRNWLETTNPAQVVSEYDILSLRGSGRMRLDEKLTETKKGNHWIRYSIIKSR
ncbi:MAG: YlmH/Sll1252 family protein [Aerococcus sp.]|nr:YlmH/Sll1252 family protein [Aerococcus sp.]